MVGRAGSTDRGAIGSFDLMGISSVASFDPAISAIMVKSSSPEGPNDGYDSNGQCVAEQTHPF